MTFIDLTASQTVKRAKSSETEEARREMKTAKTAASLPKGQLPAKSRGSRHI